MAGDLPGALEDYRFISDLYPDMIQPYNNSGRILEALGRLPEAAAMYERAHEKDPNAVVPLYNAWYLAVGRLRDPVRAEREARALVALQPDYGNAAHTLAWSFLMQRRFAEAEDGMRATLKLDSENPYALPNLAHLLLRRGAMTDALAVYRRLARVGPEARKRMDVDHDTLSHGLALRTAGQEAEAVSVMLAAADAIRVRAGQKTPSPVDQAARAALLGAAGKHGRGAFPHRPRGGGGPAEKRGRGVAGSRPRGPRRDRPRRGSLRACGPHGLQRSLLHPDRPEPRLHPRPPRGRSPAFPRDRPAS